jgi:protein-S-isoprenylcysteine O-methyltransferase Ste14
MLIWRTAREDKTLQAELPGYAEFTKETRYRSLPGVW